MDRREFLTNTAALAAAPLVKFVAPEPDHVTLEFHTEQYGQKDTRSRVLDNPSRLTRRRPIRFIDLVEHDAVSIDPPYRLLTYVPVENIHKSLGVGTSPFTQAHANAMMDYYHGVRPRPVRLIALAAGLQASTSLRSYQRWASNNTPSWKYIRIQLSGYHPKDSLEAGPTVQIKQLFKLVGSEDHNDYLAKRSRS